MLRHPQIYPCPKKAEASLEDFWEAAIKSRAFEATFTTDFLTLLAAPMKDKYSYAFPWVQQLAAGK